MAAIMAAINRELREVLSNLNDYLSGGIDKPYSLVDCSIEYPDGEDQANTVVADDVPFDLNDCGDWSDQQEQQYLDETEFYSDGSGFFAYCCGFYVDPSGLYYPHYIYEWYQDIGDGTTYYDVEPVFRLGGGGGCGGVQDLSKKPSRAIDIIDPVTGEKLQFC